nr:molybdopterin cofactor-binding domain-containing protein [Kofleriaceae bacterium]
MISRRALLKLGAAAGGAFVVGCAFGRTGGTVWREYKRTGTFQPNAWIRITPDDRVIFTLDRVEMGQGTTTSHAAMVAEELGVDPRVMEIEAAEASRDYDNPDKQIRIQITGGSTSTRGAWRPLREAGAVAREMLRAGAAWTWGVSIGDCRAVGDGSIAHAKSKRVLRYGALAGAAAAQDVPAVELKGPAQWAIIGRSIDRLDIRPKVDGRGVYGMDVQLPGMLTAVIVRPPAAGATLVRMDAASARARAGVVAVEACAGGVAVVARGYWEARTGADALAAEWTTPANAADTDDLRASYRRLLSRDAERVVRDDGDARAQPDTLDAFYELPYLAHATMEPQNATAWLHDGRCEVWAPTQAPGIARWRVADALGLDLEDVQIHTTLIGGGFGRRGLVDYCVDAADVARRVGGGRPVKVVFSREDDLARDWYRPMAMSRLRGSVAGGRVTGWRHHVVTQSILADEGGDFVGALLPNGAPRAVRRLASASAPRLFARGAMPDSTSIEGAVELPYAIPNLRVELTPVETPVPVGFWRSVGHSHNAFVTEGFLDELLHAAGKDAYLGRRELLAANARHLGVLDLAATKAGWTTSTPPPGVGRGIAVHASFESYCAMVIEASVDGARVRVRRAVVAFDCGRVVNPGLVAAQGESAVIFGLSAALKQQITHRAGRVQETNFGSYKALRMFECPIIETYTVASDAEPSGIGEPGVPPVAPALCGAIFAATGKRIRRLPVEAELAT